VEADEEPAEESAGVVEMEWWYCIDKPCGYGSGKFEGSIFAGSGGEAEDSKRPSPSEPGRVVEGDFEPEGRLPSV
jgi:hypothetical protein